MIRIALTKGRLEKQALEVFREKGFDVSELENKGRRLILPLSEDIEVVLAKAPDVLTYVSRGVCDLGIVGRDTIMEGNGSFYEVLDLGFGRCHFALATVAGKDFHSGYGVKRLASKYPKVTADYFAQKGMDVDVIKIEGSVELAPLLDLADGIVDIVESGNTLKENGLVEIERIADLSARLIVNTASMKLKQMEVEALIAAFE